jgi:hypothetical protein
MSMEISARADHFFVYSFDHDFVENLKDKLEMQRYNHFFKFIHAWPEKIY